MSAVVNKPEAIDDRVRITVSQLRILNQALGFSLGRIPDESVRRHYICKRTGEDDQKADCMRLCALGLMTRSGYRFKPYDYEPDLYLIFFVTERGEAVARKFVGAGRKRKEHVEGEFSCHSCEFAVGAGYDHCWCILDLDDAPDVGTKCPYFSYCPNNHAQAMQLRVDVDVAGK